MLWRSKHFLHYLIRFLHFVCNLWSQVWRRHLSENERKVLVQFLPKDREIDVDQTVQSLLMGDNLHFGNPFLIWQVLGPFNSKLSSIIVFISRNDYLKKVSHHSLKGFLEVDELPLICEGIISEHPVAEM